MFKMRGLEQYQKPPDIKPFSKELSYLTLGPGSVTPNKANPENFMKNFFQE